MEIKKISKEDLKSRLDAGENILLVDVLPPEYYGEEHIAGAKNAPVYEINFLEHVEKLTNDKSQRIVLYSEDPKSLATEDAAIKLIDSGYENVETFPGGLSEWKKAGWGIESGQPVEMVAPKNGKHEIDAGASIVGWVGRNAKYAHHGKISVKSGHIVWEEGSLVGGEFVLNTKTIQDEDLADNVLRSVLEKHLKSSDFFDVEKFPEAAFVVGSARTIQDAKIGQPNYEIKGELTIKNITNKIEFLAMIVPMPDGSINGQAHLDIDRTLWNVRYGSEKFFEKLGMHLVNDVISLELFLVAKA